MYKSYKRFGAVSTCHRNWKAALNTCRDSVKCSYIHGYSRIIELEFECDVLTDEGWVYDFGDCKDFKAYFDEHYDHCVIIAYDDPQKEQLYKMEELGLLKLTVLPMGYSGSIEGCCKVIHDTFNKMLKNKPSASSRGCRISRVRIYEHENNYAEFIAPPVANGYLLL